MSGSIVITLDQLSRPQPGGIATYARGLVRGLIELIATGESSATVEGVAPRSSVTSVADELGIVVHSTRVNEALTTRLWRFGGVGVPARSSVVHATSMAGPFRGGRGDAVHSVAVQDLLWRDHLALTTSRGASFHEQRLLQIRRRGSLRVLVTSSALRQRLIAEGFAEDRVFQVRLGHDPIAEVMPREELVAQLATAGVSQSSGNFTLAIGTIEPRKNYERLIVAHSRARMAVPDLGPLLIAGARGWGDVDLSGAVELGAVSGQLLSALITHCRLSAYVPIAEGWGLPPIEVLSAGRPVLVSQLVPSVAGNENVETVDPFDIDSVIAGLIATYEADDTESVRAQRISSVAELSWANCARDHLTAWS